jgi:AraC family transcriptional regulator
MVALEKGNFMGQVNHRIDTGGVIASLSCYPHASPYDEDLHYHETLHLSMILRGGNAEKRKIKRIECLPGTVTWYDAGEPHRSVNIVPDSCQINVEITDKFMTARELPVSAGALEKCSPADRQFLMLKVYKELLVNDPESSLSITSALLRAVYFTGKAANAKGIPNWVPMIKESLQDRWNDHITLNELALVAGLHPANLSGYFPQYFGCTIGEYRRKLKVEKALDLINNSGLSLTAIAHNAGFSDQSHFTRTCKELTGWNPKQLKAMQLR